MWETLNAVDLDGVTLRSLEPASARTGNVLGPLGAPIFVDAWHDWLDVGHAKMTVDGSAAANGGRPIELSADRYIDQKLPPASQSTSTVPFGAFDLHNLPSGSAGVFGFPMTGIATASITNETLTISTHIPLPAPLQLADGSPVSAMVTFVATASGGFQLQSLHLDAQDVDFGPFTLNELHVSYDRPSASWQASGSIYVLGEGTFSGSASFQNGQLTSAMASYSDVDPGQQVIAPLLYLNLVSFTLSTSNPVTITGNVEFSVGGEFSTPFGTGAAAQIDGSVTYTGPDPSTNAPWKIAVQGPLTIMGARVDNSSLTFNGDGAAAFVGSVSLNLLGGVVSVSTDLRGTADSSGDFDIDVNANLCVIYGKACAGGELVFSSLGIGGCVGISGFGFSDHLGGYYQWGASSPNIMFDSCGIGPIQLSVPGPTTSADRRGPGIREIAAQRPALTRQASPAYSFTFPASDADEQVIAMTGQGAPPTLQVNGPDSQSAVTAPGPGRATGEIYSMEVPQENTTYVVIAQPPAGSTWSVAAAPGSAPIVSAGHAAGYPMPAVTGTVSSSGGAWRLAYTTDHLNGDHVVFEEDGPSTRSVVGTVTQTAGDLSFTPGPGAAGARSIVAQVFSPVGVLEEVVPVTTYTVPVAALRPGSPTQLSAQNQGSGLAVRWQPPSAGPQPAGYVLEASLSDGRSEQQPLAAGTLSASVDSVYPSEMGTIHVAALEPDGTPGDFATLRIGPAQPHTARTSFWASPVPYGGGGAVILAAAIVLVMTRRRRSARP